MAWPHEVLWGARAMREPSINPSSAAPTVVPHYMAANDKCLAQSNKSRTGTAATKKLNRSRTGTPPILVSDATSLSRRYQQGFINWRCGHILCPALLEGTQCQSRSRLRDRTPAKLFHRGKGARGLLLGSLVEY